MASALPTRRTPLLAGLAAVLFAAEAASLPLDLRDPEPRLALAISDEGRLRLALIPEHAGERWSAVAAGSAGRLTLDLRLRPRERRCELDLGQILCLDPGPRPVGGGLSLAWHGVGWRLSLDYERLLAPLAMNARALPIGAAEAERIAVGGDFRDLGLTLALGREDAGSADGAWLPIAAAAPAAGAEELRTLSLDLRYGALVGRIATRRPGNALEAAGGAETYDLGLLVRMPWRAEFELGTLNVWPPAADGERRVETPRTARTPYVRYRQDF